MVRVLAPFACLAVLAAGCDREPPPKTTDGEIPAARPLPGGRPSGSTPSSNPAPAPAPEPEADPLATRPVTMGEDDPEPEEPGAPVVATALSDRIRPILLAADGDLATFIDKTRRQRQSPLGVDKKVMLEIGDRFHERNEATLQALDRIPAKGPESDVLEAIKDIHEKQGDLVQLFKEALFEGTDNQIQGREDDVRYYAKEGEKKDLAVPFGRAGYQLEPFLRDRILAKSP